MRAQRTKDENFAELRKQRDRAVVLLGELVPVVIGDRVLAAGFHPHHGHGRALVEILVSRHAASRHAGITVDVDISQVAALATEMGFTPDLEVAHV